MQEVLNWSDSHPLHLPITIFFDLKESIGYNTLDVEFTEQLDSVFSTILRKQKIFTPGDLAKRYEQTREGVKVERLVQTIVNEPNVAWPQLRMLRGKFILVLTGDDTKTNGVYRKRLFYANYKWRERMSFVDIDQRYEDVIKQTNPSTHPNDKPIPISNPNISQNFRSSFYATQSSRVFVNLMYFRGGWQEVAKQAHLFGFLSRLWVVNSESAWNDALEAGVNCN